MSKQIDELWGQALDKAVPETYSSLSLEQVEKVKQVFAELIIDKCAEIADKNSPMSYPDHGIKIKRHFGVDW